MQKPHVAAAVLAAAVACTAAPAAAQVSATPDPVGDVLEYSIPLAAAGLALYHRDGEGMLQLGVSFVVAQGTTEILKHTIQSPRPDGTGYGFPSGHASAMFSAAGFVHQRYGLGEAWPFYALATVGASQRVHHNHHTTGQVVAGAVIGVGSAFLFTKPLPDGGVVGVSWRGGGPWVSYARTW